MTVQCVGVLGAGTMGSGLAQNLAAVGYHVVLIDTSEAALKKARDAITTGVRLQDLVDKRESVHPVGDVLDRITFETHYSQLRLADFLIENVPERWETKREVYPKADQACRAQCVFASNTSVFPITRIASLTLRPAKVLGMHFMNPVPLTRTVELIRGFHTSAETIDAAKALLAGMGKDCVVVNDSPGFVSNRVLMLTINEAIFVVQEGIASAQDVDTIFKSCFGHKMGPLETADLIGLDTVLYSIEALCDITRDTKFRPCPLLQKMVDAGLHGRKSGRGFYIYAMA